MEEVFLCASLGEPEQDKGSDNDIPEKKRETSYRECCEKSQF